MLAVLMVLAWRWVRRPYRLELNHLVIVLALLALGLLLVFGVYSSVGTAVAFRRLPLRDIQALEVEAIEGDLARRGVLLRIEDRSTMLSGLRLLPAAGAYFAEHEHFVDGYRVRLVPASGADTASYHLSVFCGTQRLDRPAERSAIVVPHRETSHEAPGHGGTYASRAFVDWLAGRLRQANPHSVYPSCG
jgi:hypothetical protein